MSLLLTISSPRARGPRRESWLRRRRRRCPAASPPPFHLSPLAWSAHPFRSAAPGPVSPGSSSTFRPRPPPPRPPTPAAAGPHSPRRLPKRWRRAPPRSSAPATRPWRASSASSPGRIRTSRRGRRRSCSRREASLPAPSIDIATVVSRKVLLACGLTPRAELTRGRTSHPACTLASPLEPRPQRRQRALSGASLRARVRRCMGQSLFFFCPTFACSWGVDLSRSPQLSLASFGSAPEAPNWHQEPTFASVAGSPEQLPPIGGASASWPPPPSSSFPHHVGSFESYEGGLLVPTDPWGAPVPIAALSHVTWQLHPSPAAVGSDNPTATADATAGRGWRWQVAGAAAALAGGTGSGPGLSGGVSKRMSAWKRAEMEAAAQASAAASTAGAGPGACLQH